MENDKSKPTTGHLANQRTLAPVVYALAVALDRGRLQRRQME